MPRTRSYASSDVRTHGSHDSQTSTISSSQCDKISCPFVGFDGCLDNGGQGYSRSGWTRHLKDQHLPTEDARVICRGRIQSIESCFSAWEDVLREMQCWLCTRCMTTHTWKMACKNKLHSADIIPGPFNGIGADFLIQGVSKPYVDHAPVESDATSDPESVEAVILTVELLNKLLQRRITTT
ncbi:hypothetical protein MKX03_023221, partial [Papaver bracteatum]